jgi:CO/xanthine dehydrogenase FAD-binding subunit
MRPFNHINALSLTEASAALKKSGTVAIAGGGDLLGALKDNIFPEYPNCRHSQIHPRHESKNA